MKYLLLAGLLLMSTGCSSSLTVDVRDNSNYRSEALMSKLHTKKWIHGSTDCATNIDPPIDVFRYNQSSYILRQNKCLSFEAPFIYVLFGDEKVLVLDTGATENALDFPLYETVLGLLQEQSLKDGKGNKEVLVVHSHSHSDHYTGDSQFEGKPNVTVVKPNNKAVFEFFAFSEWPNGKVNVELGNRNLTIIATPGHQEEAITI